MTLTKADIVQEVYKKHNLTKAQASAAVEAFFRLIKRTLIKESDLLLTRCIVLHSASLSYL